MAVTFGFYNSINGDRKYDAVDVGSMFDGAFKDGIFETIGTKFETKISSGMTVTVGTGRSWFNRTWTNNDAPYPVIIPQSEVILNRIDTIVIEVDGRVESRTNSIVVVKGTPATNPVAPTLIRTLDRNQYPLADIRVNANVTSITAGNITSRVGTPACPFVKGAIIPEGSFLPLIGGTVSGSIYLKEDSDVSSYEFWNKKNLPDAIVGVSGQTTGTATALLLAAPAGFTLKDGVVVRAKLHVAVSITSSCTLNVGSTGAYALNDVRNAYQGLQYASGCWLTLMFSSSQNKWNVQNSGLPLNHRSTDSYYGVGTASYYGHVMASSTTPPVDSGSGSVGSDDGRYARGNHYHPVDTSRFPQNGGTFSGYVYANTSYAQSYTTMQMRNAVLANYGPSGFGNGDLWFQYT